MFAAHVSIRTTDQHPIYNEDGSRTNNAKNITIGKHVWLGAHAAVMKGVSIGNGTVVGYGSLVTKSLPDSCIAIGSPAHSIKSGIKWLRTFNSKPDNND